MTTTPTFSEAMSAERRSHEPSMEEILASIRRIIADDKMLPHAASRPPYVEEPRSEPPAPTVARSESDMSASPPDQGEDITFEEPAHEQPAPETSRPGPHSAQAGQARAWRVNPAWRESASAPQPPEGGHAHGEPVLDDALDEEPPALLSPQSDASVANAFQALAASVMVQNAGHIEEMLRETLRPMLRAWLDDNLPVMVERLVRAEIERVSRGGR